MDPPPGPDVQLAAVEKVLPRPRHGGSIHGDCSQVEAREGRICYRYQHRLTALNMLIFQIFFRRPTPELHLDLRSQVQLPRLPSEEPLLVLDLELRPRREQEDRHQQLGVRPLRLGRHGIAEEAAAGQQVRVKTFKGIAEI